MMRGGYSEDAASQVGMLSRKYANINHLVGDGLRFDFEQFDKPFDLIFIDGDHHTTGYACDSIFRSIPQS